MVRAQRNGRIEWLTLGLFGGFYVAWLAVVLLHQRLPSLVSVALLALLGGFYMSLQHEALHGHPTSRRSVNTALAFAPLSLWLPYLRYRRSHRRCPIVSSHALHNSRIREALVTFESPRRVSGLECS